MPHTSSWEPTRPLPRATPYVVHHIGEGRSALTQRVRWMAGTITLVAVGAGVVGAGLSGSEARRSADSSEAPVASPTTLAPAPAPTAPSTAVVSAPPASAAGTAATAPVVRAFADPYAEAARYVAAMPPSRLRLWERLAHCESRGNWAIATGNGYYGGLQFSRQSWEAVGGVGRPDQAPWSEQVMRAELLWVLQGWEAWPSCASELGLAGEPFPDAETIPTTRPLA
jgi:hypothetical protein